MKLRLSIYLDPALMQQLAALAKKKGKSRSLIAEAAIKSFLTPDEADRREAAMAKRLDQLGRKLDRVERDVMISAETLALFIRFWLNVTPPVPDGAQPLVQAQGRERFQAFMETLGRRLAKGRTILHEVSADIHLDVAAANGSQP
jgi:predicted transcriptional regulator